MPVCCASNRGGVLESGRLVRGEIQIATCPAMTRHNAAHMHQKPSLIDLSPPNSECVQKALRVRTTLAKTQTMTSSTLPQVASSNDSQREVSTQVGGHLDRFPFVVRLY